MKRKWSAIVMLMVLSTSMVLPAVNVRAEESQQNSVLQESVIEDTTEIEEDSSVNMNGISENQNADTEVMNDEISTMSVNEDKEDPVIEKVEMSVEPGTNLNVEDGGEITFKIVATDNVGLKDTAYMNICTRTSYEDDYNETKEIELKLQENGIYAGTVQVADLYPCEWYIRDCHIYDTSGNSTYEFYTSLYDSNELSPYYVNIYQNGECANVNKNQTIALYSKEAFNMHYEEDAEPYLIKRVVKDVPLRTDYKEVLGENYELNSDAELGTFKGWIKAYFSGDEIALVPVYEKRYLPVVLEYMDKNHRGSYLYGDVLCTIGESTEDAAAKVALPEDADRDKEHAFLGWEKMSWGGDTVTDNPYQYIIVTAQYENYPLKVTRTYIDKNGNVKTEEEQKDYPAGTKYEDILKNYTDTKPDNMADGFKQWHMFDPEEEIRVKGTIGVENDGFDGVWLNYFNLVAEYNTQSLINVKYKYLKSDATYATEYRFVACDTANLNNLDELKKEVMFDLPQEHPEGAEYQGDWTLKSITKNEETLYYLFPNYKKNRLKLVMYSEDGENAINLGTQYVWCEKGKTVQLPDGYKWIWDSEIPISEFTIPEAYKEIYYDTYWTAEAGVESEFGYELYGIKITTDDELIEKLNEAEKGSTVETELTNSTVSQKVLTALQGKDITLSLSENSGQTKWNILGTNLPEGTLTDIDLSVARKDKENGNIAESVIDELAGNRTAEQLIFGTNEDVTFKPQLALTVNSDNTAEKGVLLQKSGDALMLAANSLIKDNAVTFTLNQKADSVIIYGTNGDIDGDNKVKIKDAMQILQHTNSRKAMNELQKGFADTDSNNKVNLQDVMREMHYISGRNKVVY